MRRINLLMRENTPMKMRTILLFALFAASGSGLLAQEKFQLQPLPVSDVLAIHGFSNSAISICPDDEDWIVYQLVDLRRRGSLSSEHVSASGVPNLGRGADIWLTNVRSGETKNLTEGKGSNWAPVWSPNGKYVAFYSDRSGYAALWVWERSTEQLRQVAQVAAKPYRPERGTLRWMSDSRRVLARISPNDNDGANALKQTAGDRQILLSESSRDVRLEI